MNIEDTVAMLRRRFPEFGKREIFDVDLKGDPFCEIVLPNEKNSRLPLTVTVTEKGCRLSVGHMNDISDGLIPSELTPQAILDVLEDRVILVFGYKNEDDRANGKTFYTNVFAITGGEDDMSSEYDRFVQTVNTPVKGIRRRMARLKGIFDICTFGGSVSVTVCR